MRIESVEQAYGAMLIAFGDLVVARTRGAPAPGSGATTRSVARRYRRRRRAFDPIIAALEKQPQDRPEDARAVANMRDALAELDAIEPTPGTAATAGGTADESPTIAAARARLFQRYGEVSAAIRFDSEQLDRGSILGRSASETDPTRRRDLFLAMSPVWQAVDGDGRDASPYRKLLRSSAARWAAHGSPIEANAVALGMPPGSIESTLRHILAAWRKVIAPGRIEPWDYRFEIGAAARRLDRRVPVERLLAINGAYLTSLGADPDSLGIQYDVLPRPGRPIIPVAFTLGMGPRDAPPADGDDPVPRPPWVFATYAEGGLGDLLELLHESGHAIHMAAIRTRPAFVEFPGSGTGFLEGTADVLGWDVTEPDWQRHWLGEAAEPREALLDRYGAVMLDICWALFEIELHRHPDRRPNDVWTEITADGLGVVPHPEWSWWAIRGQLIDGPGYLANYALSAIMAAAVRARIHEVRGAWFAGDPGWYRFVADALFTPGASRSPAELLGVFLGGPLTADPLLADLSRAT
jgi:hypothetical protein